MLWRRASDGSAVGAMTVVDEKTQREVVAMYGRSDTTGHEWAELAMTPGDVYRLRPSYQTGGEG